MTILAAFRNPESGTITTGANHFEAFCNNTIPLDSVTDEELLNNEGFLIDGVFHTRQESFELTGFYCVEDFGDRYAA